MKKIVFALALGLFGCPNPEPQAYISLVPLTGPPPTLKASLNQNEDVLLLTMSAGVAMAVRCSTSCNVQNACDDAYIEVENADLIDVREAYRLSSSGGPTFVLGAKAPGTTSVTLRTRCGSKTYRALVE